MSPSLKPSHGDGRTSLDRIEVLHVDDDPGFADVTANYLEREDDRFEVSSATSTEEGLAELDDHGFDCVVSDYDMPGRTGIEFLRSVRETYSELPFVLFTGKGSEEVASEAISAGATDYLQKQGGTDQFKLLANRIVNAVSRAQSQRAERHLRELAENTDHLLYIFSHDWEELLFINSAYEELWGRSVESLRASPTDLLNGIHEEDRDRVLEAMERMSNGEMIELECRVTPDETATRWVRLRGEPIREDTGAVVRVAGFATDITHRKELQQELEKRTERLQEAQRVARVGSWEWHATSNTVVWSDETYRIFGRNKADLSEPTFEDWLDAVHPADRETARTMVETAMETGSFPTFEHRLQRPDGEVQWVECRGDVAQAGGETARITGTVLDIDTRHGIGREFAHLVEAVEEYAIFSLDTDGHVTSWNRGAERIKGYEADEIVGEHFSTFYPEEKAERGYPDELLEEAKTEGEVTDSGWRLRKDGSRFWADVVISAVFDDDAQHRGFVKVTRDGTGHRRRERQFERQLAQFNHFGSVLAHDLRTPLMTVQGRLDLARETGEDVHLDHAETALERLEELIDNLAEVMREGELVNEIETVDVGESLRSLWDSLETDDATLTVREDRRIRADPDALQWLLENLVSNALEHGGADVEVTLGSLPGGYYVEDDGPGISEADRERVFDVGYSTKADEENSGFGLASVHQLVVAHGWDISVTEGRSGGARFEIADVQIVE